jgi:hypothetical protein
MFEFRNGNAALTNTRARAEELITEAINDFFVVASVTSIESECERRRNEARIKNPLDIEYFDANNFKLEKPTRIFFELFDNDENICEDLRKEVGKNGAVTWPLDCNGEATVNIDLRKFDSNSLCSKLISHKQVWMTFKQVMYHEFFHCCGDRDPKPDSIKRINDIGINAIESILFWKTRRSEIVGKPLFHTSKFIYEVGQIIRIEGDTYWSKNRTGKNEILLENSRPKERLGRSKACFAFGSIEHCQTYAGSVDFLRTETKNYFYQVELLNPELSPMRPVSGLGIALANRPDSDFGMLSLAREYWHPTESWNIIEYLSSEMKIVKILENVHPDPYGFMGNALSNDIKIEKRIIAN